MRGGSHRRGPGAGPQGVQELHETAAAKTANFHLVRAFQDRLPRPQQMAHPGIPLLGRRTEPAKVPHLHEPPRQHVLQEPPQEFLSSQPGDFCQAALPVGPAEAHAIMIHGVIREASKAVFCKYRATYANALAPLPTSRASAFHGLAHAWCGTVR